MINPENISKIGLGTWGFGGLAKKDPNVDAQKQIDAVAYTFDHGVNYFETTLWYSEGEAARIVAEGINKSKRKRADIFISQALYEHSYDNFEDLTKEVDQFHVLYETNYSDALLMTMKGIKKYGVEKVFEWLDGQLADGRARYVSVTHADLDFLIQMKAHFGDKLFGHEIYFNFEIRFMEDLGITKFADENMIRNVIAVPLRRNMTAERNWTLLMELAEKYEATQNQVILAWIIARGFLPLVKSENPDHIDENLAAQKIKLNAADIEKLNSWRPDYAPPKVDWAEGGNGVSLTDLVVGFDEDYDQQHK